MSDKEMAVEESLQKDQDYIESSIMFPQNLQKLTPAQQSWVRDVTGMGEMSAMSYARVDDSPSDTWDPSAPVSNPSRAGPVAWGPYVYFLHIICKYVVSQRRHARSLKY